MKTNFIGNSTLLSNNLLKKVGDRENILNIGNKNQNNIYLHRKDTVEISDEGMLKLKLRNLQQADKLEKRKDEYKEGLENRLKMLEEAKSTLDLARDLIKQSMKENISMEEKKDIEQEVKDMLEEIQDIANEAIKNRNQNDIKTTENVENKELEEIRENKNNLKDTLNKAYDLAKESVEEKQTDKVDEDKTSIDFNEIDIENNPLEALMALAGVSEALLDEIAKVLEQIEKLQKSIDKLLGEDVEKKERKATENENDIKITDENNKEVVGNLEQSNN